MKSITECYATKLFVMLGITVIVFCRYKIVYIYY